MIKKRSRPQTCREVVHDDDIDDTATPTPERAASQDADAEEAGLPVHELIELRKLRKAREGIDAARLVTGDAKRRRKRRPEDEEVMQAGLRPGTGTGFAADDDDDRDADRDAKARRAVRSNNFTQQTNALDVDKHMMAYIEENMKLRRGQQEQQVEAGAVGAAAAGSSGAESLADRLRTQKKADEEGSVTNSMAMLTAIPEVDLGMDARLRNIEDTEKAKAVLTQEKKERRKARTADDSEEHLVNQRFYRPNLKMKSDADIIRDAKREAMGLPPQPEEEYRPRHERPQTATDEMVMERFKKRMRK